MSEFAVEAAPEQIADAHLHATVWEGVFDRCKANAERRTDINGDMMMALATFALIVGGEYRRVANARKIEP